MPPKRQKRWTEAEIDEQLEAEVATLFDRLYDLQPDHDKVGDPIARVVKLSTAAKHDVGIPKRISRAARGGAKSGALEAQNPAQQAAAPCRTALQESPEALTDCGDVGENAAAYDQTQNQKAPRQGLEP